MNRRVMVDPALLTKPWFRKLRTPEKLAFLVILCVCDELGIWLIDEEWVEMLVGQRVDWKSLLLGCNENIKPYDDQHLFIPDYFRFQYPRASRSNPVWQNMYKKVDTLGIHSLLGLPNLQYLDTVNVHSLDTVAIPTRYQLDTDAVHKEKEEVLSLSSGVREDNSEDIGEEPRTQKKEQMDEGVTLKPSEHEKLVEAYGLVNTKRSYKKLSAYKLQTGKRYKSDYGAILSWVMREVVQGKGAVPEPRGAGEDRGPVCDWCGMTGGKHTGGCDRPGNLNGLPERDVP